MNGNKKLIFAKDISLKFGIPYSTVNLYTNLGLLSVVERKGNKRLYDEEAAQEQLQNILRLTNEGYPLRLICKKLK